MLKKQMSKTLRLSLAFNIIIFYACLVYTTAGLTKHYANAAGPVATSERIVSPREPESVQEADKPQVPTEQNHDGSDNPKTVGFHSDAGGSEHPPQSVKDTFAKVCQENFQGAAQGKCYYRLLGKAKVESNFNSKAENITEREVSHGIFQIRIDLPNRPTKEEAQDVEYATRWTVRNWLANGYATDPYRAIQMHNGLRLTDGNGNPRSFSEVYAYANKVRSYASSYEREGI